MFSSHKAGYGVVGLRFTNRSRGPRSAFTLVEMLIAVAITLIMMAAVVTLFANITSSVRVRRATIEMSGQLRHVHNMLQQDLNGATCPGVTWQKPDSNHGYIELVEGAYRDSFPSLLTDGLNSPPANPELDYKLSSIPSGSMTLPAGDLTDAKGLGDYDDILMFTSRNEHEPFLGRAPDSSGTPGAFTIVKSPLAEVIWFAIENPSQDENDVVGKFFGEPGMRTVYRRTLLIAPWLNPFGNSPGVVRFLDTSQFQQGDCDKALAALIAFQDQYDVSVRLEWDALAQNGSGQWKIICNTLADLTKRENRFAHYGFDARNGTRGYPFAAVSQGKYSGGSLNVVSVPYPNTPGTASVDAQLQNNGLSLYVIRAPLGQAFQTRPFVYMKGGNNDLPATANAILNDDGQVVRVVHGPVPLWGSRHGEDVMLTNVLAFDLRVYDPGAPIYQETTGNTIVEPCDKGWIQYYNPTLGTAISTGPNPAVFVNQGAYVDMGYLYNPAFPNASITQPFVPPNTTWVAPWFAQPRGLFDVRTGNLLAPGYAVYDTWSTSYENNGLDEDGDGVIDQGTNGLDDVGRYINPANGQITSGRLFGPDDVGERETSPPYDKPLRAAQIVIRMYESDSRQIRQVRVTQHFMTE